MTFEEYVDFIKSYYAEHEDEFCGVHDCHDAKDDNALAKKIVGAGLRVSRASGDVENVPFRTTFYFLTEKIEKEIFDLAKSPIFVRIPKELLEILDRSSSDEFSYYDFCGFGLEERDGETGRKITPLTSSYGANVRLLPTYLIDGYLDIQTGKFVENPMAYERLSTTQQEIVRNEILNGNASCLVDFGYILNIEDCDSAESF